jgi:hypothetical protein
MSGNGPSRPPEHGHTTIAVRPGGEIVPSEDVSLYGEPAAIVSEHLPSRLKIWSPLISDLRYIINSSLPEQMYPSLEHRRV